MDRNFRVNPENGVVYLPEHGLNHKIGHKFGTHAPFFLA